MARLLTQLGFLLSVYVAASQAAQLPLVAGKVAARNVALESNLPRYEFTMPLDHYHNESQYAPHTNATFSQGYYLESSFYKKGGPVIVHTLGEDSPSYWLGAELLYTLANATGGLAILWPQRYYNGSAIVPNYNYTTENLRFHSTQQALADLAYFSQRVQFPGFEQQNLTAPGTPWIVIGGSYGGVISAFTRLQFPNLFYGAIQSSGVSVPIVDFWQFYDVVRRYAPQDCMRVQQQMVQIGDKIFMGGNKTAIRQYKVALGAYANTSTSNVAWLAATPMGAWQGRTWVPPLYQFAGPGTHCANITSSKDLSNSSAAFKHVASDILRNAGMANETSTLLNPLLNYLHSIQTSLSYVCYDGSCLSSNSISPFGYLACKENPLFATGYTPGASGRPAALPVVSRLITAADSWAACKQTYGLTGDPDTSYYQRFGGLNMSYPRLVITTGQKDIWRGATPLAETNADDMPNPRLQNLSSNPAGSAQVVIASGGHEWDLLDIPPQQYSATLPPPAIKDVHNTELQSVQMWLAQWRKEHA